MYVTFFFCLQGFSIYLALVVDAGFWGILQNAKGVNSERKVDFTGSCIHLHNLVRERERERKTTSTTTIFNNGVGIKQLKDPHLKMPLKASS